MPEHIVSERKSESLLASQRNRRIYPGQISVPLQSLHHRGLAVRLGRRLDGEKRQPSQFRSRASIPTTPTTDTITSTGLIVAGNSPHAHAGREQLDSDRPAMGFCAADRRRLEPEDVQQQGRGSRGWGMYYDRGELYTYLSLPGAQSIAPGGPFGVNQQLPFVGAQFCPTAFPGHVSNLQHDSLESVGTNARCSAERESEHDYRHRSIVNGRRCDAERRRPREWRHSVLSGGLCAQQQASLHHEHHARRSMAAAQRSGDRYRRR